MILRPYQETMIQQLRSEVAAGRDPLCVSPCGSGKGAMIAFIVHGATGLRRRVMFVVHGKSLVIDMSERISKLGIPHGVLMGGEKRQRWHHVQVASIDTLHRMAHPPQADLLIADEADGAMSPTWRKTLDRYPNARLIGTTATAIRSDGRGLGKASGGLFDSIVFGPTEEELIDAGYLVGSRVLAPPPPADLGNLRKVAGEFNAKQQASICDKVKVIGDIVEHYKKHAPGRKTAAFGVDKQHAFHIAQQFNEAGVPFAYVDDSTDRDERARIWKDLDEESGKLMGVASCGVCTVGWDHSIVSCLVVARKTASLRLHKQILGRGSRIHPGKEDFLVLDHVGNVHYHEPYGLFEQNVPYSLDGEAIRPSSDDKPPPTIATCKHSYKWPDFRNDPPKIVNGLQMPCYATFRAGPRECPYCGTPLRLTPRKIEVEAGELTEIVRPQTAEQRLAAAGKASREQKAKYYRLMAVSRAKNLGHGWAYKQFCKEFGYAPPVEWRENNLLSREMVLDAIKHGARTSGEVSESTGMDVPTCSSYMSSLHANGEIEKTGVVGRYTCYKPQAMDAARALRDELSGLRMVGK